MQPAYVLLKYHSLLNRPKFLDAQFHRNARRRSGAVTSRAWLPPADDWLRATSDFPPETHDPASEPTPKPLDPEVDDEHAACAISGEHFRQYYDAQADVWRYRDAKRLCTDESRARGLPPGALVKLDCCV